jgi:trehalose 6-phosphate synthase/phosphatase
VRYDDKWIPANNNFDPVKQRVRPLLQKYVSRTAGSEIEEKDFALVWHYRNVVPELAFVRANELKRELRERVNTDEIGVYGGNKIIEIKPAEVSKGAAAAELDAVFQPGFILCAGDDYTDEDMFEELDEAAITIKVGPGETRAKYQIGSVADMIAFLEKLSR